MPNIFWKASALLLALCLIPFSFIHADERQQGWWDYVQHKAEQDGYSLLTTPELLELLTEEPDLKIIDCRYDYEYLESRVKGSLNVPLNISDTANLSPEAKDRLTQALGRDRDKNIVFYCRDFR